MFDSFTNHPDCGSLSPGDDERAAVELQHQSVDLFAGWELHGEPLYGHVESVCLAVVGYISMLPVMCEEGSVFRLFMLKGSTASHLQDILQNYMVKTP